MNPQHFYNTSKRKNNKSDKNKKVLSKKHIPVLLQEIIDCLVDRQGIVIDATFGGGGHSGVILDKTKASVIAIDQDGEALARGREQFTSYGDRVSFVRDNFSNIKEIAKREKVLGRVSFILMDLGISSLQLDEPARGFSFRAKGPLDMRMDETSSLTAAEIVNTWPEKELADLIYEYGEERLSRKIAREIVRRRKQERFKNTEELAESIEKIVPKKSKIHPATKTFQALRIKVNEELRSLEKTLKDSWEVLEGGGRIAIISFHSLEDRIVKRFFKEMARKNKFRIITKKPIISQAEEVMRNSRSRSAKLRIAEKI